MAFPGTPTRTTYVSSTSNATSWAAFSSVSVAAGSMAIFIASSDGGVTLGVGGSDTNWTELGQNSFGSSCTGGVFYWFNSGGSPVNKSFTLTSSGSEQFSGILLIVPRATAGYTLGIEGAFAQGNGADSDPTSLTPTVGAKDFKWIVSRTGDSSTVATAAPTNYSNLTTRAAGGTNGASTNTAERDLNATSEDPGTFTSGAEQWVCWTLAVWEDVAADALGTPPDVDSGTPTVGAPAIGQTHALTATGVATGTTSVGSPALGQVHGLTATGVATGSPTVGTPTLGISHVLTADPVTAGTPSVGAPAIGQVHGLTATGVASSAPSVGAPALGQVHGLTATGVAAAAPTVGAPVLTEGSTTDALGTPPDVDAGSPTVGAPAIGQVHDLTATGVASSAPSVGAPALGQVHDLTATGIAASSSSVGSPALDAPVVVQPSGGGGGMLPPPRPSRRRRRDPLYASRALERELAEEEPRDDDEIIDEAAEIIDEVIGHVGGALLSTADGGLRVRSGGLDMPDPPLKVATRVVSMQIADWTDVIAAIREAARREKNRKERQRIQAYRAKVEAIVRQREQIRRDDEDFEAMLEMGFF